MRRSRSRARPRRRTSPGPAATPRAPPHRSATASSTRVTVSALGRLGVEVLVAQHGAVGVARQQTADDGLDPLRAQHVVGDDLLARHPRDLEGERHHGAGAVLAGGAVHDDGALGAGDDAQGRRDRVGALVEVAEVVLRPEGVVLRCPVARPAQEQRVAGDLVRGSGPFSTASEWWWWASRSTRRSGPGPSRWSSVSERRSTTSVTPSSSTSREMSAPVRSWRLSERISRPLTVRPPSAVGSPPTSRMLARPSRSIQRSVTASW